VAADVRDDGLDAAVASTIGTFPAPVRPPDEVNYAAATSLYFIAPPLMT